MLLLGAASLQPLSRGRQRTHCCTAVALPSPHASPLQVATLVQADWLFLLTDVPNLYTANPATDPTALPIYEVPDLGKLHVS